MKRQLLSGLLAVVLLMTSCSGGSNSAGTKETGTTQDITQEAEETASQEATQISEQGEEQTPAEGTDTQQTAKGIRGMSASEFEPIESENGNIVILYTNDVHCAVEKRDRLCRTCGLQKADGRRGKHRNFINGFRRLLMP